MGPPLLRMTGMEKRGEEVGAEELVVTDVVKSALHPATYKYPRGYFQVGWERVEMKSK